MSPTFNYASGNPTNLTGGANASMADIQGPLVDLRTAINGSLDEINVPNLAAAFTTYKPIERGGATIAGGSASYVLGNSASGLLTNVANTGTGSALGAFVFDPAPYTANARTTKLFLRADVIPNLGAPGVNFAFSLALVSAFGGGSGINPTATAGAPVSGSNVAINTPPAATRTTGTSGDFNAPAGGAYFVLCTTSGTTAAGSVTFVQFQLSVRQV